MGEYLESEVEEDSDGCVEIGDLLFDEELKFSKKRIVVISDKGVKKGKVVVEGKVKKNKKK